MEKLRVLLFEYITGGGLSKEELPGRLAKEGLLMLQSLTHNLAEAPDLELTVMLDQRMLEEFTKSESATIKIIAPNQDYLDEFNRLLPLCDAVWPIAPESDGLLQKLCEAVEKSGKILFNSNSEAVAVTGNKWLTYQNLTANGIPAVPTDKLHNFSYTEGDWIVKSVDGVGCSDSFIVSKQTEYESLTEGLDKSKFIIQPHLYGLKTSLSCLYKHGRGWLLSVNLQQFIVAGEQYQLTGLIVNISTCASKYFSLLTDIAATFPGLWGYVGIDLIETEDKLYVLEINPRLTSSFAGIYHATGINPARAVLELLEDDPILRPTRDRPVSLIIQE